MLIIHAALVLIYSIIGCLYAENSQVILLDVGPLKYEKLKLSTELKSFDLDLDNTLTTEQSLQQQNQLVVNKNAGTGRYSTVFLQGSQSSHILTLKNNIRASDPSLPSRVFNFGDNLHGLTDEIKVIQGPSSIEFGSDAMAGVIQMNQVFEPIDSYNFGFTVGSFNSQQALIKKQGRYFEWALTHMSSKGPSEVEAPNAELDSYNNLNAELAVNLGNHKEPEVLRFEIDHKVIDLDDYLLAPQDDPNYTSKNKKQALNWQKTIRLKSAVSEVGLSYQKFERRVKNEPDINSSQVVDEHYSSQSHQAFYKLKNLYKFLSLGVDYYYESAQLPNLNTEVSQLQYGLWSQLKFQWENIHNFHFGLRSFNTENTKGIVYQSEYVLDLNPLYLWTRLSSGFKAASLSDLYVPVFGNIELKNETNKYFELGVKYEKQTYSIRLLYFKNLYKNLIQYTQNIGLENLGKASIEGFELSSKYMYKNLSLSPYVNFWYSKNLITQKTLTLRPDWVTGLRFAQIFQNLKLQANVKYIGKRYDYSQQVLNDFIKWDFYLKYKLNKETSLDFSLLNAFKANIRWAESYTAQPREYFVGINYIF